MRGLQSDPELGVGTHMHIYIYAYTYISFIKQCAKLGHTPMIYEQLLSVGLSTIFCTYQKSVPLVS